MKKCFFKYKRNEILFWLTIILFVCIYVIIRDCDFPIIRFHNFIDKYMELLFIKSYDDSTFYNISISYIAAYIFYLIQIYIPSVSNHKHSFKMTKIHIEKYINAIKVLMLIADDYRDSQKDCSNITEDFGPFYIIEDSTNEIFKITFLDTYMRLKERIESQQHEILSNPLFNYLDNNLSELLCILPTKELFIICDNIYEQIYKSTNAEIIDNGASNKAKMIIDVLQRRYGFLFETYRVTDNINQQSEYVRCLTVMSKYTNDELAIKVRLQK